MRLCEFDDADRLSHKGKDKKNRSIEERLEDIKRNLQLVEIEFDKLTMGRPDLIRNILGEIIDDISEFFDFCNNMSNNDLETRDYLDQLKTLYDKSIDMFDSI